MSLKAARCRRLAACIVARLALSACTQSPLRTSPDFGDAVTLDQRAQIADPDARYAGSPAPGSNGQRVGLAQKRYDKNEVIPPSATGASTSGFGQHIDQGASSEAAAAQRGAVTRRRPAATMSRT